MELCVLGAKTSELGMVFPRHWNVRISGISPYRLKGFYYMACSCFFPSHCGHVLYIIYRSNLLWSYILLIISSGRFAWLLIFLLEMEWNRLRWCDSCMMYVESSHTKRATWTISLAVTLRHTRGLDTQVRGSGLKNCIVPCKAQ